MNYIVELLKENKYQLPRQLLFNYKKINIKDNELILLIYLINQEDNMYNPKKISNDLNIDLNDVLSIVNSLCEKNIIKIDLKKKNNVRTEFISLDPLFEKIAFSIDNKDKEENNSNIYSLFESEFGRPLSPMEYEIISAWMDNGCSEELITLALKEATYNGVSNLRYIDKIIYEWGKKGIKTKEDVEKNRKSRKDTKSTDKDVFYYDWLNDSSDN